MSLSNSQRTGVAFGIVLLLAAAFWLLVIGPKRDEAGKLSASLEHQQVLLSEAQSTAAEATVSKREFPRDYRELVTLGKAVPESDETASLLVQLSRIAKQSKVEFESLSLGSGGEATLTETSAQAAGPTSSPTPIPPTEAEAALLPLGATVGTANLAVMPYSMNFTGSFFHVADFIRRVDDLIRTRNEGISVRGRLLTLDGFSLTEETTSEAGEGAEPEDSDVPDLSAKFTVTSYLAPPSQASEPETAELEATPEAEGTETATGTPSSFSTGAAR